MFDDLYVEEDADEGAVEVVPTASRGESRPMMYHFEKVDSTQSMSRWTEKSDDALNVSPSGGRPSACPSGGVASPRGGLVQPGGIPPPPPPSSLGSRKSLSEALICGVCLEAPSPEMRVDTVCGHAFCADCMAAVLRRGLEHANCPLCRHPLHGVDVTLRATGIALGSTSSVGTTTTTTYGAYSSSTSSGATDASSVVAADSSTAAPWPPTTDIASSSELLAHPAGTEDRSENPLRAATQYSSRGAIAASVSCVWRYSDQFVRRVGGHDLLTADSWLVVSVNYFHVGATVDNVPPGAYVVAFRLKRLAQFKFGELLSLYIDGVEQRRVVLAQELAMVGAWDLVVVGALDVREPRSVTASMKAGRDGDEDDGQMRPKGGFVVDCLVLFPPSNPPPSLVLRADDSRAWTVLRSSARAADDAVVPPPPREVIHLRNGAWRDDDGRAYCLRPTDPVSFVWPHDGTVQTLHTVDDHQLVWRTTNPDEPEIRWSPTRATSKRRDPACACAIA
mmetsp:Transcript_13263/g.53178  ORF Transcript_13263/g.53178 Transcript_13263/m.53178 type:complete len:506 (-) Transcript_13263:938-2455(-)